MLSLRMKIIILSFGTGLFLSLLAIIDLIRGVTHVKRRGNLFVEGESNFYDRDLHPEAFYSEVRSRFIMAGLSWIVTLVSFFSNF